MTTWYDVMGLLMAGRFGPDWRVAETRTKGLFGEYPAALEVMGSICEAIQSIYPRRTREGYSLAEMAAARIEQARAEQDAGTSPLGLAFASPKGKLWRSSNFVQRVLAPAYLAAG